MNDNNIVKYNSMTCDIIKYNKIRQPMPDPTNESRTGRGIKSFILTFLI